MSAASIFVVVSSTLVWTGLGALVWWRASRDPVADPRAPVDPHVPVDPRGDGPVGADATAFVNMAELGLGPAIEVAPEDGTQLVDMVTLMGPFPGEPRPPGRDR